MTSIPGTDSDEQTRFILQLTLDEKLKGNIRKQVVNEVERQAIMDKFYEKFGIRIPWRKFGEGWTAQQGEEVLDTKHSNHDDDIDGEVDVESRCGIPTQETDVASESRNIGSKSVGPSSSRPKVNRKRPRIVLAGQAVADVIRETMEVLHSMHAIRMWYPLYKASINHMKEDPVNRQTFLFYGDEENMVLYLEYATSESRVA
ncbi:hypothetical protein N665_0138s0007 [Sinapis alba]|nr:hypothetical protein N665_0138s0007 [Sinapis alba]